MQCPNCSLTLAMTEREGVEIDYCPQCRGVWLDRGELDKLIERATQPSRTNPAAKSASAAAPRGEPYRGEYRGEYQHKKKRNFLGDFFDF